VREGNAGGLGKSLMGRFLEIKNRFPSKKLKFFLEDCGFAGYICGDKFQKSLAGVEIKILMKSGKDRDLA
jgi:hypothetical protein